MVGGFEGWIENLTGWAIGPSPNENISDNVCFASEIEDLYNKLEYVITPTFYDRRDEWVKLMKNSIGKIAYYFNSHRMMRRYVTEAYLLFSVMVGFAVLLIRYKRKKSAKYVTLKGKKV